MRFSKKHLSITPILLTFSLLIGCGSSMGNVDISNSTAQTASPFDAFLEDFFREEVSSNTINLHFTLSDPENYGIEETPITLGNLSTESSDAASASIENTLAVLKSFDYETLSTEQQLDYDLLSDYLSTSLEVSDLTLYDEILRPSTGIQAQLPVLYEEYRFYDKSDIEDYLALIALTDSYFEQIIAFEQQKASAGLFMSDYACDNIISQCETFVENPDEHYLIVTFNNKLSQMTELTDAERISYQEKNASLVKECVLPAYQKLASALTQLLGSGKNDMGLCYLPKGKEYYEYLVYQSTGSSKSLEEIQDMISNKRSTDLTAASTLLREYPNLSEECNAVNLDGRDAIATLHVLQEKMLSDFPAPPSTEFTVSYIDECMEDYMAPAFYITAPIDNYEKNSIFINASTDSGSMQYFTTLAHEGFPGHLYQTVMSYEAGISPMRSVLNFPGYVEGWATYVEMLSYQYAGLDENVANLMVYNQSALLSLYATTDLGIHYEGWSFSDMLAFWDDYGITDEEVLHDVYLLILQEPAHYLKYYVGYLEFLELKEKAQETYGDNYSDIAFHQAVLSIGPAPFEILEKYLDVYYSPQTSSQSASQYSLEKAPSWVMIAFSDANSSVYSDKKYVATPSAPSSK